MADRKFYIDEDEFSESSVNWYSPKHKLQGYKSVIHAELLETGSSAGDWSGVFIQKLGGNYYVIPFSQENMYPYKGYMLWTGELYARYTFSGDREYAWIKDIVKAYCEDIYGAEKE